MSDGSADALRRLYVVAIVQLLCENLVLFKAAYAVRSPNCETMLAKCWPIVCSRRGGYNVSDQFDLAPKEQLTVDGPRAKDSVSNCRCWETTIVFGMERQQGDTRFRVRRRGWSMLGDHRAVIVID